MSKENPDPKTTRDTFHLLWDLWNALDNHMGESHGNSYGTIISRYASIIDDRINNSGYSRANESLMLFESEQLENELKRRKQNEVK